MGREFTEDRSGCRRGCVHYGAGGLALAAGFLGAGECGDRGES